MFEIDNTEEIDYQLSISVIFFFIIQSANSSIKTLFPDLGDGINAALSGLSGILILVLLIRSMKIVTKLHTWLAVRSYLLFLVVYFISIFQNILRGAPLSVLISESMLWTLVWWLPMGLIAYSVNDKHILYRTIVKWSYLLSVVTLFSFIAYVQNIIQVNVEMLNRGNYNMFFSYMLVFTLIIHLNELIDQKRKRVIPWCLVELVAILSYGSRGAILCLVSYLLLKFLMGGLRSSQKLRVLSFVSFLGIAVFLWGGSIVEDMDDIGMTSRTLEMVSGGDVAVSDGRDDLRKYTLELIAERPLLGYGLGGEFYELYQKAYGPAIDGDFSSLTPHNGFLQLFLNFGVLMGSLIGLAILYTIILICRVRDYDTKTILIILASVFVVPSLTVGDGIFTKPGIALYLFVFMHWYHNLCKSDINTIET